MIYEYDTYKTANCPLKIRKVRELPSIDITIPENIVKYMCKNFAIEKKTEEFLYAIYMDVKGSIKGVFLLTRGTLDCSLITPSEVMKRALLLNSQNYIIVHNHPSGNYKPSKADIEVVDKLSKLSELMGIKILDSIIIGNKNNFYSFLENKLI